VATAAQQKKWIVGAVAVGVLAVLGVQLRGLLREAGDADAPPPPPMPASARPTPTIEVQPPRAPTYSNIYKYDYVGPETCGRCHAQNYEKWRGHPHSRMNRNASAGAIVGNFEGAKLEYGGGRVVFSKAGGEYLMTLYRRDKPVRELKVTRVIGSRFVQMYIGVQTQGPEPEGDAVYADEVKLPFAFWITQNEWFPQTYDENPTSGEYDDKGELTAYYAYDGKSVGAWKNICIKCHNTYPYALRFDAAPEDKLIGFPAGEVALKSKPIAMKSHGAGLSAVEPFELVTMGISCESCHFGGREHALNGASISFVPKGADVTLAKAPAEGSGKSPYAVNSICHQCHAADPQGPIYPNGAASWNAREAADLIGGACKSKIACTSCHNPHEAGPTTPTTADNPAHVAACVKCHDNLKIPEAAAAHGGHGKTNVSCLDCHMPREVHGLASVTRTHHIGSPTDTKMLAGDYPNACNLCHLDKPLRWTLDALATTWKKPIALDAIKGASLDKPMGDVWLAHKEPVVRQIAAGAYARSPLGKGAFAKVLKTLDDDSPPSRMFGVLALEGILGRRVEVAEYTPWAPPATRKKQIEELAHRAP
jgi:hypothetical protein